VLFSVLAVTWSEVTMPKSILIVDDSGVVRTATRRFLEHQKGLRVCGEAVDGLDSLAKARDLRPDLIILDFAMPRMNGFEAARRLRAMLVRIPIVLFSMFADEVRPQDALAAGVNAVVSKANLPELHQQIQRLLDVS
jgi:two-component system, NarL family, invasion response regulator UvrY